MPMTIYPFSQIAENINVRVMPGDTDLDRYVGLEHLDPESLKLRRWGSPDDVIGQKLHFWPGDIIYGKRRAYQRKLAVADFEGICSAHAIVLRAKADVCLPEFLPFFMQSELFHQRALEISVGSLSPTINWSSLARQEFPLPHLDEQRRIADLLWAADDTMQEYQRLKQENQKLIDSARKHIFAFGNKKASRKESKIGQIPSNWDVKKLGEVFEFLDNMRIPLKDSERNKRNGEYPYYGAVGIIDYIDGFIFDEITLLLEEDGMNLLFRSSPVVFKASGKYWVNNHAHVLRPCEKTDVDFYSEYLEYISYEPYVTGTYQKKITKSDCMAIPVISPPLGEQKEIAGKFNAIHQTEVFIDNHIIATKQLKKQLLSSLLGG